MRLYCKYGMSPKKFAAIRFAARRPTAPSTFLRRKHEIPLPPTVLFHWETPMRGTEKGTSIFSNVAATQKLQSPRDPKMDKFHTLSHTDPNNLKGFFVSLSRTCAMTIHHVFPEQDLPMPPHLSRSRPAPMAAWHHRHWRRG